MRTGCNHYFIAQLASDETYRGREITVPRRLDRMNSCFQSLKLFADDSHIIRPEYSPCGIFAPLTFKCIIIVYLLRSAEISFVHHITSAPAGQICA